jgi:hypothetical protein
MSVIYTAIPLADFYQKGEGIEWLKAYGLDIAPQQPAGRNATPEEIQKALNGQPCDVNIAINDVHWIADVSEKKTFVPKDIFRPRRMTVRGSDYSGNDKPISLGFDGSYELIRLLLRDLANLCGPFVLMSNGEDPELIWPSTKG